MIRHRVSCDCGFTGDGYRSETQAAYALRQHSCDKHRRRAASRARQEVREAAVDRTPKPCHHKEANHQHGTDACYKLDRCRCGPCAQAHTAYEGNRNRQTAYGRWQPYVDAEPARQHVRQLMAAGIGLKRVAKLSGVAHGALSKLIYGSAYGPSQRVRATTAAKLLAVQPTTDALADGARVGHTGTTRRLQALVAIGYSQSRLARELGILLRNLTSVIHGQRDVTVATARAVRDLYEQLSMKPATGHDHRSRISANRSRRYAANHGWAPPLADRCLYRTSTRARQPSPETWIIDRRGFVTTAAWPVWRSGTPCQYRCPCDCPPPPPPPAPRPEQLELFALAGAR